MGRESKKQPPMTTDKQIAANRANAKLSTGPKSLAGKYISSRNAATHGCLAESVLLPNESADRFRDLHRAYLDTFPPESQEMPDLVETIAVARLRLRRIRTLEAANLAHEQRAYNQALDRLLKIQKQKSPGRESAEEKNVDSKPIFDTNKGLTADQKPIRTIDEASSNPHRTGGEPRSDEPTGG